MIAWRWHDRGRSVWAILGQAGSHGFAIEVKASGSDVYQPVTFLQIHGGAQYQHGGAHPFRVAVTNAATGEVVGADLLVVPTGLYQKRYQSIEVHAHPATPSVVAATLTDLNGNQPAGRFTATIDRGALNPQTAALSIQDRPEGDNA